MPYRIILGQPLHPAGAAVLAARADVETIEMFDPPAPVLHAALANADGLVAWLERVDKAALAAAPRLRAVSRIGVGFDTVDIPACTERGIAVMVVNGTNDLSVAEHAMMLMLGVAYAPAMLAQPVIGGSLITVGMAGGVFAILLLIVISAVYTRWRNDGER